MSDERHESELEASTPDPADRPGSGAASSIGILGCILERPGEFEFLQLVRLVELFAADDEFAAAAEAVGDDARPTEEAVRFRTHASLARPDAPVVGVAPHGGDARGGPPYDVTVAAFGLFGPHGVLPGQYTRWILEREREGKEGRALRAFLDLFNHRATSHFYRASRKYRALLGFERHRRRPAEEPDDFSETLRSLVGLTLPALRERLSVPDDALLYYAGLFLPFSRSAAGLEGMLGDYFGSPVEIEPFRGEWIELDSADQSRMPDEVHPNGVNMRCGIDTLVGARVLDVQSRFCVRVGPLSYEDWVEFVPPRGGIAALVDLTRAYVGLEYEVTVRPVLCASDVPEAEMAEGARPLELGRTTWLRGAEAPDRDFSEAEFAG